jgi:EmrB/QacA subfamily drug resistance transporter
MVIAVAVLGTSIVNVDTTAVNVALPKIMAEFDIEISGAQWLIDLFLLSLATIMLVAGALGDRFGRVRIMVIGASIFSLASFGTGLAVNFGMMLFFRAIQGVGGAMLAPGGMALINAIIAAPRRGRAVGLWITFTTTIIALGPLVGGWLVDNVHWRYIFIVNVPLGLLCIFIAGRYIPESRDDISRALPLDWQGAIALMVGMAGLLFGLIEGPRFGWGSPYILAAFALAIVGIFSFLVIETRSRNPLMPLRFFRIRNFSGANLITALYFGAFGGAIFFLTLNFIQVQEYTAVQAGLALLPVTFSVFVLSSPMGRLTDRFGGRPLIIVGGLVSLAGFILFSQSGIGESYLTAFFPAILVFGMGFGTLIVPVTVSLLRAVPDRYSGMASGSNYAATRIGNMLAIAIFGGIMLTTFQSSLEQKLRDLNLEPTQLAQIMASSGELGGTSAPTTLPESVQIDVADRVKEAYVAGFGMLMWICAALMAAAVLVAIFVMGPDANPAPQLNPASAD